MRIRIDINDPKPQFEQLMGQIKSAVSAGVLNPGDPLPSIRQLANDLELNNKTVAKAYRLLERDNVVESRGYRGTFLHAGAKDSSGQDLGSWTQEQLADVISRLRSYKITDSEIRNAFSACMKAPVPAAGRDPK